MQKYLSPDYMCPSATNNLDATMSPLALLVQTCNNIGLPTPATTAISVLDHKPRRMTMPNVTCAHDKRSSLTTAPPQKPPITVEGQSDKVPQEAEILGIGHKRPREADHSPCGQEKTETVTRPNKKARKKIEDGQKCPQMSSLPSGNMQSPPKEDTKNESASTAPTSSVVKNNSKNAGVPRGAVDGKVGTTTAYSALSLLADSALPLKEFWSDPSYTCLPQLFSLAHPSTPNAVVATNAEKNEPSNKSQCPKFGSTNPRGTSNAPAVPNAVHCTKWIQSNPVCVNGCQQYASDPHHWLASYYSIFGFSSSLQLGPDSCYNGMLPAPQSLFNNLCTHSAAGFTCNWYTGERWCGKLFSTTNEFAQHLHDHATPPASHASNWKMAPKFPCNWYSGEHPCGKVFSNVEEFSHHLCNHATPTGHSCNWKISPNSTCGKVFGSIDELVKHMQCHAKDEAVEWNRKNNPQIMQMHNRAQSSKPGKSEFPPLAFTTNGHNIHHNILSSLRSLQALQNFPYSFCSQESATSLSKPNNQLGLCYPYHNLGPSALQSPLDSQKLPLITKFPSL